MDATDVGRFGTLSLLSPASATITAFGIDSNPLTFGSDPASDIRLFYQNIAPTHALIEFIESKAFLVIQGKTGVEIDGCRIREGRVALGNGDNFTIQGKRFKFDYPPKALRKLMDPASPVKGSRRRVRLSMVRAAVIDSPTPGAKIVQLGGGDAMLREEGMPEDLARQDSPYALHRKAQTPPSVFPVQPEGSLHSPSPIHSPSPMVPSIYPSLPDLPPAPPSPVRPPSPQKDSLRGRVLIRRAMLAEEELEELEVAGGLFAPTSDSESDRSTDSGQDDEMALDSEPEDMMVDSEPEMVPESEAELQSEPDMVEDDEVMEMPTPKPFNFTRISVGGRSSLGGGPPIRPERPSFKLNLSMSSETDFRTPATPIKEEDRPTKKDLWTTPRRKKLTDAEKKAIQERRKSALAAPDLFFAGRVPGLGPSLSPTKLFGVKEESVQNSIFSSPSPVSPKKTLFAPPTIGSPMKNRSNIFGASIKEALAEENEEDDPQILLQRMREEMEIMKAKRSPKKEPVVASLKQESMDVISDIPATPPSRERSPSKGAAIPTMNTVSAKERSVSPMKDLVEGPSSPAKPRPKSRSASPMKTLETSPYSTIPSLDLRTLMSPRNSPKPSSPCDTPMDVDAPAGTDNDASAEPAEKLDAPSTEKDSPLKPASKRRKTVPTPTTAAADVELAPKRATRSKKVSTPSPAETSEVDETEKPAPKKKATRGRKVTAGPSKIVEEEEEEEEEQSVEDDLPKKRATRCKRAPTPVADEPRVTKGKSVPSEEPKTRARTRTKTAEIENEEPEPVGRTRRTRNKTETDVDASDVEEIKPKGRKPRGRTVTEPIPEVEVVAVKTRTRAKKDDVKKEEEEASLPRTRTRTRTRTAGK
ncbi:hypothetical protein BDZ89DRAFT_1058376 [Hymenopellis radicata]|nr:hypothetical protein BDZ89DRAFT_1058376 [Hymenopellis radicata]